MQNPEAIIILKKEIESDEKIKLIYEKFDNEELIFEFYKKITEAENSIDNYMKELQAHKKEVNVNILHNNERVRAIFLDYLEILKGIETKLNIYNKNINDCRKNIIEDFSVFFKQNNFEV